MKRYVFDTHTLMGQMFKALKTSINCKAEENYEKCSSKFGLNKYQKNAAWPDSPNRN